MQESLDQLSVRHVLDLFHDPAALAADAPAADVEDLDGRLEVVAGQREDVGVGIVLQDDGVLFEGLLECGDVIAQARSNLVIHCLGGGLHLLGEPSDKRAGVPRHERTKLLGEDLVVGDADPPDTRRGALIDVPQQARTSARLGAPEHSGRARADGEGTQEQVEGFPDSPGVRERPEVPGARAFRSPHHLGARHPLAQGDGEVGVGLVVAVLDVEPGVVLLDPGVLERECLDLGAHHSPLDGRRRRDHGRRARVQAREGLEIVG